MLLKLIDGAWSRIELFCSLTWICIISKKIRFKGKLTWGRSRQSQWAQKLATQNLSYISKVSMIIGMKVRSEMKSSLPASTFIGNKIKSIYLCMVYPSDWKNSTRLKKILVRVLKWILQKSSDLPTKIFTKKQELKCHLHHKIKTILKILWMKSTIGIKKSWRVDLIPCLQRIKVINK